MITITDVRTYITCPDGINLIVVRVDTNQPGLYGLGCATYTQRCKAVVTAIEEYVKPLVLGRNAMEIQELWSLMNNNGYWRNGPVVNNAVSGVDMALWDIKGKVANMPVYDLLGGKYREAVALYCYANGNSREDILEQASKRLEEGFHHIRLQYFPMQGYPQSQRDWKPQGAKKGFYQLESRSTERLSLKEVIETFWEAVFALGMPVIILGGIYGGFFTPTEAAAVACVYSLVVGCLVYRTLTWKQIWNSMCEISVRVSSMLTIVCVATAMAWFVSSSGLAQMVSEAVLAGFSSKFAILTVINVLLFVLGCVIDPTSIILLTCPIIIPITKSLGMSTVAVGAFMIMNIAVGMVTPPFAGTLYISSQIAGEKSIGPMVKKLVPYIILMFLVTLAVAYVPAISTALPQMLGMTI